MIDFACKHIKLDELVRCGLGITKAEYTILKTLMQQKNKAFSTEEIAKKLKLDISTVQRAVKKLHEKNILIRKQQNLSNGGYIFVYQAKSNGEIRKIIMGLVHSWTGKVEKELASL
jgi:predicted transcriptional regulator